MIAIHSFISPKLTISSKFIDFFLPSFSLEFHRTADAAQNVKKEAEDKKCQMKLNLVKYCEA